MAWRTDVCRICGHKITFRPTKGWTWVHQQKGADHAPIPSHG